MLRLRAVGLRLRVLGGAAAAPTAPQRALSGEGAAPDTSAKAAELSAARAAAAVKHKELVEYLSETMARTCQGARADLRPASSFAQPSSEFEAWTVQQLALRRLKDLHPHVKHCGYRVCGASLQDQRRLGVEKPFVAPILANRMYNHGARIDPAQLEVEATRGVELDIGWTSRLPFFAGEVYPAQAVGDSVSEMWLVAQVPAHRFSHDSKVDGLMTIADFGGCGHTVVSSRFPHHWHMAGDTSLLYADLHRGSEVVAKGVADRLMEHPMTALTVALNFMTFDQLMDVPSGVLLSVGSVTDSFPGVRPDDSFRGVLKVNESAVVAWLGFGFPRRAAQ